MRHSLLRIFSLVAIFTPALVTAQTFTPAHDTVFVTYPGSGFLDAYNNITVPGPDSIDISWKIIDEDFSDDTTWVNNQNTLSICDNYGCYTNASQALLIGTEYNATYQPILTDLFKATFNLQDANPGTHYVTIQLKDNGSAFDTTITFVVNKWATSVNSVNRSSDDIVLYPNPVRDEVNVVFNKLEVKNIALYNAIGKNMIVYRTAGTSAKLDVSKFPGGVYFLRMSDSKGNVVATKRITKQ